MEAQKSRTWGVIVHEFLAFYLFMGFVIPKRKRGDKPWTIMRVLHDLWVGYLVVGLLIIGVMVAYGIGKSGGGTMRSP